MKILVTGCAGYIGSILCQELLAENHKVFGVDKLMYKNHNLQHILGNRKFEFHQNYIRSKKVEDLIKKADVIIPLAALVGAPLCDQDKSEAISINQIWIKELCNQISKNQRIVFPNTNSMYGTSPKGEAITEEYEGKPLSLYAQTKSEAEKYVLNTDFGVSFRLATVFGISPRMRLDLLVNDLTEKLHNKKNGEPGKLKLFQPMAMRNYVHVRDVANAFIFAIEDWQLKGVYNLGHPEGNYLKAQLVKTICEELNINPEDYVEIGDGQDPDKRDYLISNDKILSTGFRFNYVVREGIKEVISLCSITNKQERLNWRNV